MALLLLKHTAEFTFIQGLASSASEVRLHEIKPKAKSLPFLTFLKSQIGHVPRLMELSRFVIRKEVGVGILRKVSELGLPKAMQDYVLIPEIHDRMQKYTNNAIKNENLERHGSETSTEDSDFDPEHYASENSSESSDSD